MKYTLKKLCADGENQVAYMQVADDSGQELGEICVTYDDDEEIFKKVIAAKVEKLEAKQLTKDNIKIKIETILKKL
jgi:hypothetical protein